MKNIFTSLGKYFLLFILSLNFLYGASPGSINGMIKDSQTGEALPYANISIVGTSLGTAADINGKYTIQNVMPGTYKLRATYIGYKNMEVTVTVTDGAKIKQDFKLKAEGVVGETVVVTAQAEGQNQAINQQLSALSIVNVVSAAKIQELPDANAAESVGRLPGVSILREGGEGNKVVIRGLSPKYNVITINGVRMAASDYNDRSSDLSMISPYSLEGIEVVKALTPDMDADALGGTVNFKLKTAKEGLGKEEKKFAYEFMSLGSYNKIRSDYGNYNLIGTVSTRLFDDELGILGQFNIESRNRSAQMLGAGYSLEAPKLFEFNQVFINSLSLSDIRSRKDRIGANFIVDYKAPSFKIIFSNLYSRAKTNTESRGDSYNLSSNNLIFSMGYSIGYLDILTNVLSFEKEFPEFKIEGYVANTFTKNEAPTNYGTGWVLDNAGLNAIDQKIEPTLIPKQILSPDLSSVVILNGSSRVDKQKDQDLTGKIDFTWNLNLTDFISSKIKFGARYRYKDKSYTHTEGGGALKEQWGGGMEIRSYFQEKYPGVSNYPNWTSLPLIIFQQNDVDNSNFLDGDYPLINKGNFDMFRTIAELSQTYTNGDLGNYIPYHLLNSLRDNYSGNEYNMAEYIMATVNIGENIQIIPGVRYESLTTNYTAVQGDGSYANNQKVFPHHDTTVEKTKGYLLPMVHLRYKPFDWFDIRLAYTNTLNYPDFSAITPLFIRGVKYFTWHNTDLNAATSNNYDLYLSFYENTIGLFTIGAFYKEIKDLIFQWPNRRCENPQELGLPAYLKGDFYTSYINNSNIAKVKGLELDWQTHFWYLPGVLSGTVFNVNYTHINSEALYPQTRYDMVPVPGTPFYQAVVVDTFFRDRMIDQPDDIVNMSLGFDYSEFSIRFSLLYTSNLFKYGNFWNELRSQTAASTRYDISIKQGLPWFGLQLFCNINNVNSQKDISIVQGNGYPSYTYHYGMTVDIGLRLKF